MRKKICIVSSSRADLGQLSNIIKKFQESKNFKTSFVITGSHLSKFTKHSYKESEKFSLNVTKKILINFSKFDEQNINIYFSEYVRKFSKYFFKNKPDLLLVLGDRYEILAVVIAAFYLNIKIIHLHGGELTLGSKDDATRHAITKLSNYHFVANEIFKKRLLNMGEHPKNIFNVGSPSLDNIKKLKLHSIATLEKNLNISLQKNFIIVTIHPEAEKKATIKLINNLFRVLEGLKDIKILICSPNADAFSDIIRIKIKKFVKENNN